MLEARRLLTSGVTHGAALLIGWAAWSGLNSESTDSKTHAQSSPIRNPRVEAQKSPDDILAVIAGKPSEPSLTPAEWKARKADYLAEFADRLNNPPPDDFKAALAAELKLWNKDDESPSATIAVLMYHWAETDLPALMDWMGDQTDEAAVNAIAMHLGTAVGQILKDKGVDAILPVFRHDRWGDSALFAVAEEIATSGDPGRLTEFKEKLSPEQWNNMKLALSTQWSWDDRSQFVDLALAENQPEMVAGLARFQRGNPVEAGNWILELIDDESLDAGFRGKLAGAATLKHIALSNPNLPMDQRLALMGGGKDDQQVHEELARTDVAKLLLTGRDWSYEFRHGIASAHEVLANISQQLSKTNSNAPDAVLRALFQHLVEQDSTRAMELLDDLPPAERAGAVLDAARNRFFKVDPNIYLSALQQVPADDPQHWDARLDAWVSHGPENYRNLDAEYVSWVKDLPEGVDRDMALYSLALAAPSLAADLRSEVKNDELRRKLSQNP